MEGASSSQVIAAGLGQRAPLQYQPAWLDTLRQNIVGATEIDQAFEAHQRPSLADADALVAAWPKLVGPGSGV